MMMLFTTLASSVAVANSSGVALDIQPKYCVVSDKDHPCETTMQIAWHIPQSMPVCLYENERKLQCWEEQNTGQIQYTAKVKLPAIYSLAHAQTGEIVVDTQLELQTMRSSRRRLRSVWGFF